MNVHIYAVGMACPVGLRWAAACAAMRAGINRRQMLPYRDDQGEPIVGSFLAQLDFQWNAEQRWLHLLALALQDVSAQLGPGQLEMLSLVLALPREMAAEYVARELSAKLGFSLRPRSLRIVAEGSHGGYTAIAVARELLRRGDEPACLVAGADSLVHARTLLALSAKRRLLTSDNSDGVIPGEAAACLVLTTQPRGALATIRGLGFGQEPASLANDIPLRANGVTAAARIALGEAGFEMHELDFRLSDAAGESFAFREMALLVSRLLRRRKEKFPLWLSAQTLGDTGAAAGVCGLASVVAGFVRSYAPGPRALGCVANEQGQRAAVVLEAAGSADRRSA